MVCVWYERTEREKIQQWLTDNQQPRQAEEQKLGGNSDKGYSRMISVTERVQN